jgi:intraflagellar transport protein 74
MGGVRVKTAGPGRQVQDISFFHGILRRRVDELSAELGRLQEEIGTRTRDKTTHQVRLCPFSLCSLPIGSVVPQALERQYETLITEVRNLEGTLADYNLARDKVRAGTDPAEVVNYCKSLKNRNMKEAQDIDAIFLERQDLERGESRLEGQIQEIHDRARARLDTLPPAQREEYASLLERNTKLSRAVEGARVSFCSGWGFVPCSERFGADGAVVVEPTGAGA